MLRISISYNTELSEYAQSPFITHYKTMSMAAFIAAFYCIYVCEGALNNVKPEMHGPTCISVCDMV